MASRNLNVDGNGVGAGLIFYILNDEEVTVNEAMADFLGISPGKIENQKVVIKKLNSPSTYFIHCDLIDKEANLFNGKPSSILASFDKKGEPFEKVFYQPEPQHVLRETSTDVYVKSLNIPVKDENGNLFDFNGMPLTFVLEIN